MKNRKIKRVLSIILCIMLILSSTAYADTVNTQAVTYADIVGNKYETQLREWIANGFIKGYPDGTFKPENKVTRSEFMALVNRLYGFTETVEINYSDIVKDAWYYKDAAIATKAGYIQGAYGKLMPLDNISRQEMAVILARLTNSENAAVDNTVIDILADGKDIPAWSKAAVSTALKKNFFEGFVGNTFNPTEKITRLEAVVALDRAYKSMYKAVYASKGTYGPAEGTETLDGDVVIIAPEVTLKNTIINGKLILRETIGEGSVYLDNVVVKGETIVKGGGANSIIIKNSTLGKVTVIKEGNTVRIVATGTTVIDTVNVGANVKLEEYELTGAGFNDVVVLNDIPEGANVIFEGKFDSVEIDSPNTNVTVQNGTIGELNITNNASNVNLHLAVSANVSTLTLNAAAKVTGKGSIGTANINANGVEIEQQPTAVKLAEGVKAIVAGKDATETTAPSSGGSSGGGGGGGSTPAKPRITVSDISVVNASTVTFNSNVAGASIKWNGVELSESTQRGLNTITVPLMASGQKNTLVVEKSGYVAYTNNNIVWTEPYDSIAELGEWQKDRTEPAFWEIEDGWIRLDTKTEPANNWYAWQGKKAPTNVGLTSNWMVETQLELTEEMIARDGIRTSVWLAVDGSKYFNEPNWRGTIDWACMQFKRDSATDTAGWQTWDSIEGKWEDVDNVSTEAGIYTLTMIYENGTLYQYIDGVLANSYDINVEEGISAPTYIIVQSYSFGDSYSARWKVPTVKYVEQYPADAKVISDIAQLKSAIANQQDGETWIITTGIYDVPRDNETLRDNNGQKVTAGGQAGWYFPITANDLTIIGIGNPVITSSTYAKNGAWASQNLITVWGDNVTIKGLTIQPKVDVNKTIEVVGDKEFTITDCTFTPNTVADVEEEKVKDKGGALYFNGMGVTGTKDILIENNTFNYACIAFDGVEGSNIIITGNTFENIAGYAIGNTYWGSADRKEVQWADVYINGNNFNNVDDDTKIIAARLNQTFILDGANKINGEPIDKNDFGKHINFNNLANWIECKDNRVIVDGVTYRSPYIDVDAYVTNVAQLKEAISRAEDGDTIFVAAGEYGLTEQLNITKAITLEGIGQVTLKAANTNWRTENGYKHLLAIHAGSEETPVIIKNIIIDANNNSHGVNTLYNAYGILTDVTIKNSKGAGLTVNGSTIVAHNLNTNGNLWGAVNVDPGKGVQTPSVFELYGDGELTENYQIWSDGNNVNETATVTVIAEGYTKYAMGGTTAGFIWSNRELTNAITIDKGDIIALYTSIQEAINDAEENAEITIIGNYVISKAIVIDKALKLTGDGTLSNATITEGPLVYVKSDNVTISGLTFEISKKPGVNGGGQGSGILVSNVNDVTLENNTFNISGNTTAVELHGTTNDITVKGNTFNGNADLGMAALALNSNGSGIVIVDNTVIKGAIGSFPMTLDTAKDIEISGNEISESKTEGIFLIVYEATKDEAIEIGDRICEENTITEPGTSNVLVIYNNGERLYFPRGGVEAQDFGVMDHSGVKGYSVGFRLIDTVASEVEKIEIRLYNEDDEVLAVNTSNGVLEKYPNAIQLSAPFDVLGDFDYEADGCWEYSGWLGETSEIPVKAEIIVIFKNGLERSAVNTRLTGDTSIFEDTTEESELEVQPVETPETESSTVTGEELEQTEPAGENPEE